MGQDDTTFEMQLVLRNAAATQAMGRQLARIVEPSDCILLSGPIGAGKSLLARSLIQALQVARGGRAEDVPSPTYTLVQQYEAGAFEIWHADLYRLSSLSEIDELGLTEAMGQALCLVEWPDRLGDDTPPGALSIALESHNAGESRLVLIRGPALWQNRLGTLAEAISA